MQALVAISSLDGGQLDFDRLGPTEEFSVRVTEKGERELAVLFARLMWWMHTDPYGPFEPTLFEEGLRYMPAVAEHLRTAEIGANDIALAVQMRWCAARECIAESDGLARDREAGILQRIATEYPESARELAGRSPFTIVHHLLLVHIYIGSVLKPRFEASQP